ncbi:helix-turn-helix transcriptional regulator [Nocardia takedensis]|uniref:helix-turn-helix transcriptional regulator n=1 Tax=Nocardia takedensis TaxID=259390 RepID=UPI003F76CEDA
MAEVNRSAQSGAQPGRYADPGLSPREIEVLLAYIMNETKSEVGSRLVLSLGTVNTILTRIRDKYAKVGRAAPHKAALLARALQDNLIDLDDL